MFLLAYSMVLSFWALGFMFLLLVITCLTSMIKNDSIWVLSWELFNFSSLTLEFPILIDKYSLLFFCTVTTIFASVMMFSHSYMSNEKFFFRFHALVALFVASMFALIMSPNIISLLLGWDGLGLTSYLLVIYFSSVKSANAGLLTALTNRIGDCLILISISLASGLLHWNFSIISMARDEMPTIFLFLVVLAASTKSAQVPFSAWLPAAMAAPTPVSSLVHSSTLVTAGVYLLIRFHSALGSSLNLVIITSILTMLLAGASAMFETDMKKIVALSTLSQLGVMMLAVSLGLFKAAFFHLVSHAFFKALLFIGVGNLIHQSNSFQDLRQISFTSAALPATLAYISVANLSLCGTPFFAGFFSKDLILESCLSTSLPFVLTSLIFLATALTASYTLRFFFLVFSLSMNTEPFRWLSEKDGSLFVAMSFLMLLGVTGGALILPLLKSAIFVFFPGFLKNLTLGVVISGALMGSYCTQKSPKLPSYSVGLMWGLPVTSGSLLLPLSVMVSDHLVQNNEKKWNEYSLTQMVAYSFTNLGALNYMQTLYLTSAFFTFIVVLTVFLI